MQSRQLFEHEKKFIEHVSQNSGLPLKAPDCAYSSGVDLVHYTLDFTAVFARNLPEKSKSIKISMLEDYITTAWMLSYDTQSFSVLMIDQLFGSQIKPEVQRLIGMINNYIKGFKFGLKISEKTLQRLCFDSGNCFFLFNDGMKFDQIPKADSRKCQADGVVLNLMHAEDTSCSILEGWLRIQVEHNPNSAVKTYFVPNKFSE